jgi:CBS domain-containing protein/mannitol/fructose-specific phosphotransferase system IIA component (Ntr-type)
MDKPISASRLLQEDRIIVRLKAKTYKDGVTQLLDAIEAAGLVSDRAEIERLIDAEVASDTRTTIGPRALLAHYRSEAANELAVAVGTAGTAGSPFKFAPKEAADAVFLVLIVGPASEAKNYLKTLAALSTLLRDETMADSLAAAGSPEEFLGIVARSDLVLRPELLVRDLMSREFQSVSPDTPLSEVLHLMVRHKRRGLTVVSDNGEVLGMLTEQELLQHFLPQVLGPPLDKGERPAIQDVEVRDVMQRSVMCLSEDQLISDVLGTMLSERVSQFPVVREGQLVGFLSRTDIIVKLLEHSV